MATRFKRGRGQPKPKVVDGIKFPSTSQADRYLFLKSLEQQGIIKDLDPNPPSVELLPKRGTKWNAKLRNFSYTPDFTYVYAGHFLVEEHKPKSERYWSITLKLIEYLGVYDNFFVSKRIDSIPERRVENDSRSERARKRATGG